MGPGIGPGMNQHQMAPLLPVLDKPRTLESTVELARRQ